MPDNDFRDWWTRKTAATLDWDDPTVRRIRDRYLDQHDGGYPAAHEVARVLFAMGFEHHHMSFAPGTTHLKVRSGYTVESAMPDPEPEPTEPPPLPTGPIRSNFLSQRLLGGQFMTLLLPAYPKAEREQAIRQIGRDYTDVDIYATNYRDNPFGQRDWQIEASLSAGHQRIVETCDAIHRSGRRVTLWGFADEQPFDLQGAIDRQNLFLPRLKDHIDRYVVALEGNETWRQHDLVERLAKRASEILGERVWLHNTPGNNSGVRPWIRGIYYQYETEPATRGGVRAETTAQIRKHHDAGQLFVAGEFRPARGMSEMHSKTLSRAARLAGADGSSHG